MELQIKPVKMRKRRARRAAPLRETSLELQIKPVKALSFYKTRVGKFGLVTGMARSPNAPLTGIRRVWHSVKKACPATFVPSGA